jgi:hypothetical protein
VLNCGVLDALVALMSSHKAGIRKEAAWTISNITAGNAEQIQSIIDGYDDGREGRAGRAGRAGRGGEGGLVIVPRISGPTFTH